MSEWQAVVVKLEKIERHPQADTLEICNVLGDYTVIFKEGRFKEGDLAGYIPVDTICSDNPEFDWLGSKKRIKPMKLRGVFSLGILAAAPEGMKEGDSIVEHYGLTKHVYEEEVPDQVNTDNEHAPSGWVIPHYDLDALRKLGKSIADGEEVIITEKLEGCNSSFCHDGEKLWVKSRNWFKKEDPLNQWWDAAYRLNLKEKLAKYPHLNFFGELYGQVKGFKYDCPVVNNKIEPKVRFFDAFNVKTMEWLDFYEMCKIAVELELETVPILYHGPWKSGKEFWHFAEGQSELGSNIKEGIVVRTAKEQKDYMGRRKVLKLKSEEYSLKKK